MNSQIETIESRVFQSCEPAIGLTICLFCGTKLEIETDFNGVKRPKCLKCKAYWHVANIEVE
uniref:Uncharacterized protein n=1 Tax=viral metagenome TaxID=1070528 RepID=A0A6H1ZQG6_9ZZZZ